MQHSRAVVEAGAVTFVLQHEIWDGNIHEHTDQGVAILVKGQVEGRDTTLLRFNCMDIERSYVYAPESKPKRCQMDPIVDGNPVGWSIKQLRTRLPAMLKAAGYETIAAQVDTQQIAKQMHEVERAARDLSLNGRHTVKHNRGTDMFEAGNIRFGLEMRQQASGDGGLAIHVLSDLVGTPSDPYAEETELLAFDCFREAPHYHYGPRNKNHRIFWDKALISDPLEWTLNQFKARKLKAMVEAAGYPGVAADMDDDVIASVLPSMEARAREMQPKTV